MKFVARRVSLARVVELARCALVVAVAALVPMAPAFAQQPIVIKFSHVVAEDTPKGRAAIYFKKLVETRTDGRVKVEVYPDSRMLKDSEEIAALQKGQVQMLAPSLAKFGPLGVRDFEIFDLPYLFDSYADLHRVTSGPIGRELLSELQPKGIVGLAFWDNGFKDFSANKPLRATQDLTGLKIRVQPSTVLQAQLRALHATPVVMDFSATFAALKAGTVDGAENPASNFYTQNMQDVQKYLTVTHHGYIGYAIVVNKKFWDGLPADVRATLERAMHDATIFNNDIALEANIDALEAIERTGKTQVIRLSPPERAEWKRAFTPIHHELEGTFSKSLIEAIHKETESLNAKP
jgi:C4-dicarboxylate-binding protein DctP